MPRSKVPTKNPYELVPTADGSLTARMGDGETMHSLRGALSETIYIYGSAFDQIFKKIPAPRLLCLGLGLGYIEMVAAAISIKHAVTSDVPDAAPLAGESFEADERLIRSFLGWLRGQPEGVIPHIAYDSALSMCAEQIPDASPTAIRERLCLSLNSGAWVLSGALTPATFRDRKDGLLFNAVAFDAFSSKSTPELWTREFLDPFLADACAPTCVLSTYACTGHLKRALVQAGFALTIREGFASKRDSTLAWRIT